MRLSINDALIDGWKDLFDARYWRAYEGSLQLLGLTPEEVKSTRALDLMSRVIAHCKDFSYQDFIQVLDLLIETGRCVGRELDALRIAWACIGISELDWAPLELMVKLGEPTLSQIGRQGNANSVDNGTFSSIPGTHLIAKQFGVSRSILLGDQEPEQSIGLWGHLSKLSASLRSYPIHMEKLEATDKLKLQMILLSGLQRAAYHIRSILTFRAVFHPAFTSPEDGITSLTIWDAKYYERFCHYWSEQPEFEELQWFVLGHAVSNLKQRWEGFAYAAVEDLAGVSVIDNAFVQSILSRIMEGRRHLVIDRCEKVIRLLNWRGLPAAARKLSELLQKEILDDKYEVSTHTLFRAALQLGRMSNLTRALSTAFRARLTGVADDKDATSADFVDFLKDPNEICDRGSLFVTQSLLIFGRDESLSVKVRNAIGNELQVHLDRLGQCWNQSGNDEVRVHLGLAATIPERRFELRWWVELADVFLRLGVWDNDRSIKAAAHVISLDSTESELEEQVRRLQANCAEDEDLAIAPIQLFAYADTLVQVCGRPTKNSSFKQHLAKIISGGEVPLKQGEEGSLQSEKIKALKRLLPPVQFVRYMDMCVRAWANDESEIRGLCDTAVHEVVRIAYEDICPGADRKEFIKSIQHLHQTIADTILDAHGPSSITVPSLVLAEWLELLEHRSLIEDYLTGTVLEESGAQEIVPPGAWGATEVWFQKEQALTEAPQQLEEWEKYWRELAASREQHSVAAHDSVPGSLRNKSPEPTEIETEHSMTEVPIRIRCITDVPVEFRDVAGFRGRLKQFLTPDSIWVKAVFDRQDRFTWWAFRLNSTNGEIEPIASGQSGRGARHRIELEMRILDAKIELAYAAITKSLEDWSRYWDNIDPINVLRNKLPRTWHDASPSHLEKLCCEASKTLARLKNNPRMLHTRKLAESLLAAIDSDKTGSIQRPTNGWLEVVSFMDGSWLPPKPVLPDSAVALDTMLNRACTTLLESISTELLLDDLDEFLSESSDVVMTLDGPLSSVPVEFLRVRNVPLHSRVGSISVLLSTSLAVSELRDKDRNDGNKELLAVAWDKITNRNVPSALNFFHTKLHQLSGDASGGSNAWKCSSAVDSPRATPAIIESTLARRSFPIISMAGHGELGHGKITDSSKKSGILLASQLIDRYSPWRGIGDFRGNEALVLCSCLVARLFDDSEEGIRGLFTETFLSGGRVFCGARWEIQEWYGAFFCSEVIKLLMQGIDSPDTAGYHGAFRVARIVNKVRKQMSQEMPGALHTISAFTCFGLSTPKFSEPCNS